MRDICHDILIVEWFFSKICWFFVSKWLKYFIEFSTLFSKGKSTGDHQWQTVNFKLRKISTIRLKVLKPTDQMSFLKRPTLRCGQLERQSLKHNQTRSRSNEIYSMIFIEFSNWIGKHAIGVVYCARFASLAERTVHCVSKLDFNTGGKCNWILHTKHNHGNEC